MSLDFPFTPSELGLPDKFASWRPIQIVAMNACLDNELPISALSLPTGTGKSLVALGLSQVQQARTCVLTSTKGLQEQYIRDSGDLNMVDVRGRQNFPCQHMPGFNCEQGSRRFCESSRTTNCPYFAQYQRACRSPLVVTNYDYFIAINHYSDGLGTFDLLVLDEGHNAPAHVASSASVSIVSADVYTTLDSRWPPTKYTSQMMIWREWAGDHLPGVQARLNRYQSLIAKSGKGVLTWYELEELDRLQDLEGRLTRLAAAKGDWAMRQESKGWYFEPLWASAYSQQLLFRHARSTLVMSATLIPKTLSLLGVGGSCLFKEYPAVFQPRRNPLIHIPTCYFSYKSDAADTAIWRGRMDDIISRRLDRKGILHPVSYRRGHEIKEHSSYGYLMLTHEPSGTTETVENFRKSAPPAVLVSPSITTGYDFPTTDCEYQILAKMPTPDTSDPIMAARQKADPEYRDYIAAQSLVQSCGRGMRSEKDSCENISVDNVIPASIFGERSKHLYPGWFKRAYRRADTPPEPLPKLKG